MTTPQLSRLEKVNLRDAWQSESGDFTPWLAEPDNIVLLAQTIGVELEVEAQEKAVGPFRADILCRDTAGNWVLIENQLARTDHTHLGQLLTYAAGLNAVTIIWIAERFTDEHRAALDWLNEITDDRFNFFALEVELWKIAESPPAPKFNVVCQPNDWAARSVQAIANAGGALTETQERQLAYWMDFREHLRSHGSLGGTKPQPDTYMSFSIGRGGVHLEAVASTWSYERNAYGAGEIRVELVMDARDADAWFQALLRDREAIEAEAGESLHWYNPENYRVCRVRLSQEAHLDDRDDWPEQHAWLREKLELFQRVFEQRVKALNVVEQERVD